MADRTLERLVGFARYLRAGGVPVGTGRVLAFCRSAALVGAFDRRDLRLAARATLVSSPEGLATLNEAFDRYFGVELISLEEGPAGAKPAPRVTPPIPSRPVDAGPRSPVLDGARSVANVVASDRERLRRKDFADLSDEERRQVSSLVRRLAVTGPHRTSRRYRNRSRGSQLDLRKTLRRSFRTQGEPFHRAWKSRQHRRRPLVLILDVSGSMAPYIRPLVEFAHAASVAGDRVEVFCFGTRLTRITPALRSRDPSRALTAVGADVVDWEGGTRIGESLKALVESSSGRSALRGSVVVVCSDGLEVGDPDLLKRQMGRVSRLTHRVVWVNPLAGSPRYEPLARGMAAALPHIDVFLPGHDLQSLEALAETLSAP